MRQAINLFIENTTAIHQTYVSVKTNNNVLCTVIQFALKKHNFFNTQEST